MELTKQQVAAVIDSTILKPEATREDVLALLAEARELGCGAICVSPSMLPISDATRHDDPAIATVAGFPSGKHASLIKATEARFAVENGAVEVDVVVDIAAAAAGDENALVSELMTVREAVQPPVVLKVILETAVLGEDQLRAAVRACITIGADYVKTSTGFHPAGGATVQAVAIMADELEKAGKLAPFGMSEDVRRAAGLIGVKASGGIRDWDTAVAMIEAGATRLGVSSARAILT
ncbi:deoxyribose-phosphate aldolase [Corynebacterium anserum]|uniref:deoxyribose-phosphate aldolase n=1 Tax=Corynebacterium anserum TaxID=2684406 RepID=UPI00163A11B0|nr:deoxyribose-phosphate aldolase [Corynebacterium anserum]